MLLRFWYFITLILTALLMGTSFAHTLEMPAKLAVYGLTCTMFQHTLYPFFAYIARPIELGAIFTATGLAFLLRGVPSGNILTQPFRAPLLRIQFARAII